jgi:hypothetical protein
LPLGVTTIILSQIGLFFLGVFFLQITGRESRKNIKAVNNQEYSFARKVKHVVTLITNKDRATIERSQKD